jgi:hypothetical protein
MTALVRFLDDWFIAIMMIVASLVFFTHAAVDVWRRWRVRPMTKSGVRWCANCKREHRGADDRR